MVDKTSEIIVLHVHSAADINVRGRPFPDDSNALSGCSHATIGVELNVLTHTWVILPSSTMFPQMWQQHNYVLCVVINIAVVLSIIVHCWCHYYQYTI